MSKLKSNIKVDYKRRTVKFPPLVLRYLTAWSHESGYDYQYEWSDWRFLSYCTKQLELARYMLNQALAIGECRMYEYVCGNRYNVFTEPDLSHEKARVYVLYEMQPFALLLVVGCGSHFLEVVESDGRYSKSHTFGYYRRRKGRRIDSFSGWSRQVKLPNGVVSAFPDALGKKEAAPIESNCYTIVKISSYIPKEMEVVQNDKENIQ